jgi:hypothetical protein
MFRRIFGYVFFFLLPILGGCGSGGAGLNGSISLSDPQKTVGPIPGFYTVSVTATYTNPQVTNLIGTPISFTLSSNNPDQSLNRTEPTNTNNSGGVVFTFYVPQDLDAATVVNIVATTGNLQNFKTVTVPKVASLAVSAQAVTFLPTDGVGSTKTLTINGGLGSYAVSNGGSTNFSATLGADGTTVTITKLAASANNSTETLTVTDTDTDRTVTADITITAPLTLTPAALTFTAAESTKTVTVVDGVGPFTVNAGGATAFTATISGPLITVTRLLPGAAAGVVTVTDAGATQSIPLNVTLN